MYFTVKNSLKSVFWMSKNLNYKENKLKSVTQIEMGHKLVCF